MANLDDLEHTLVTAKDCTNDEAISLKQQLSAHNVPELRAISKRLSVKLSGRPILWKDLFAWPSWAAFAEMKQTVKIYWACLT